MPGYSASPLQREATQRRTIIQRHTRAKTMPDVRVGSC